MVTAFRIRSCVLGCLGAIALAVAWLALTASPAGAAYVFDAKRGGFNNPRGVAVNEQGEVYVADGNNDRILKLDPSLTFVDLWGSTGSADGQFRSPHGLAAVGGEVFVTDCLNRRVQVFNRSGAFLRKWGSQGSDNGEFSCPSGIAVNSLGDVFVSDAFLPSGTNYRLQKFDLDGNFLDKWGSKGSADGEFFFAPASDVAVGTLFGEPYVADSGNDRIQVFNRFGTFLRKWSTGGPDGVAIDGRNDVYVADCGNDRIEKFDPSGGFIRRWGVEGSGDGSFDCPTQLAVDAAGNVYVADNGNDRVQKFRHEPPETTITSGPSGPTSESTVSFTFRSSDPFADEFQCQLGALGFRPCTSPQRYTLTSDGERTFQVRVGDEVAFDPTPDERSFVVDTTPPETTIDSGPSGPTSDPSPTFAFSASEPGSSFECDLDDGGFAPCSSPHTVGPLADGAHSIRVRATDEAGNTEPTPASRSFTVDTSGPPRPPPDDGGPPSPPPDDGGPPDDGPPPDTAVTVRINDKRLSFNRKRIARARLTCPVSEASPPCAGRLKLMTQHKVRVKGQRRRVVLARSKRFEVGAGETKRVKLRLAKPTRRLVRRQKKARRARAIVKVGDAAGNRETVRKTLRIRAR